MGRDTRLPHLVEHATLDLGVISSSPTLGVEITQKQNLKDKEKKKSGGGETTQEAAVVAAMN